MFDRRKAFPDSSEKVKEIDLGKFVDKLLANSESWQNSEVLMCITVENTTLVLQK